jgi:hypothetical protein
MKSLLITSFLVSVAMAWPVEVPPQETEPPTRVEERDIGQVLAIIPTTTGQIGINPVLVDPVFVAFCLCTSPPQMLSLMLMDTSATDGPYATYFSNYIDDKGNVSILSHYFGGIN